MKKTILSLGKGLKKNEQQAVNGGGMQKCGGFGTGGHTSVGYSDACVGQPSGTQCLINGYLAACTGNGGGFWFY